VESGGGDSGLGEGVVAALPDNTPTAHRAESNSQVPFHFLESERKLKKTRKNNHS
jgi:uncharacterized cupin superfamily protein